MIYKILVTFLFFCFSSNSFASYDCTQIGSPCSGPTFGDGTIQQCNFSPEHCCCQSVAMSVGVDVSIDDLINIGQIDVNRESAEERIYSIEIRE